MNAEQFFGKLDNLFKSNELDKVEPFLLKELEAAREAEDYPAYIVIGNEMIGFYRSVSWFKKAFDIAEDILLLMEELHLETSEHFATTLLNTATAYRAAGELEQACKLYAQALAIYETLLPGEDYRFAGLYNNMSLLLEKMNENEQAAGLLEKALHIVEKLKESEAEQATTLTNLAMLYFKMDRQKEAGDTLKKALALFEKTGNNENTDAHYSAALAGAGEAYYHMGDYEKALLSYEKALNEVKKHFGENHSYAVLCENCAAVCECLKDMEKAGFYREKAGSIYADIEKNKI